MPIGLAAQISIQIKKTTFKLLYLFESYNATGRYTDRHRGQTFVPDAKNKMLSIFKL